MPESKKYKHIKAVVDTGNSLSKYLEKLAYKTSLHQYKPNELFKRLKPQTFTRLMIETGFEFNLNDYEQQHQRIEEKEETREQTYISNFHHSNVEMDDSRAIERNQELLLLPFLLLDVRSNEAYKKKHIVTAKQYNPQRLSQCNQFTREILQYRNQSDKLIIIYDDDETIAAETCQQLALREVGNIWLLSGGLRLLEKVDGLYVGGSYTYDHALVQRSFHASSPEPSTVMSQASRRTTNTTTTAPARRGGLARRY